MSSAQFVRGTGHLCFTNMFLILLGLILIAAIPSQAQRVVTPRQLTTAYNKPPTDEQQRAYIHQVAKAETAIASGEILATKLANITKSITDDTAKNSIDDDAIARYDDLAKQIVDLAKKKEENPANLDKLCNQITTVNNAKESLEVTHKAVSGNVAHKVPGFEEAMQKYRPLDEHLHDLLDTLRKDPNQLRKALITIPVNEAKFLTDLQKTLDAIYQLPSDANKDFLRLALVKQMPALGEAIRLRLGSITKLTALNDNKHLANTDLHKVVFPNIQPPCIPTQPGDVNDKDLSDKLVEAGKANDDLNKQLKQITGKLGGWYSTLTADTLQEDRGVSSIYHQELLEPRQYGETARAQAKIDTLMAADLDSILKSGRAMLASDAPLNKPDYPSAARPADFSPQSLLDTLDNLQQARERLGILITELNYLHPFDITLWESDQIPLYYFDDVAKLIQVLNGTNAKQIGNTEAQIAAEAAQVNLDTETQGLQNARADVTETRAAIAKSNEALREARLENAKKTNTSDADVKAAKSKAQQTAARLRDLQQKQDDLQATADRYKAEQDITQKNYDDAKADPKTDPDELKQLKAKLDSAQERTIRANEQVDKAKADVTKASSENDTAQIDLKNAQDTASKATNASDTQLSDLQTKLDTALRNESDAEVKVRNATTAAFLAAQAANAKFAFARDNAPYWTAIPDPKDFISDDPVTNTDPVRRVMLFAFPNSRTLFIRGSAEDVARVKVMVAQFDQPQAQAEMTVYTMELGSETTRGGVQMAMKGFRRVEQELEFNRVQVDTALTYLRQLIEDHAPSRQTQTRSAEEYTNFYDQNGLCCTNSRWRSGIGSCGAG